MIKTKITIINLILFILCLAWALTMIIVPLTLPPNSVDLGSDGKVGILDHKEQINEMQNPFVRFIYYTGDINCHQINHRSYFINGNQMPYCSRDMGVFFGLAIGLGIALFIMIEIKWWWIVAGLAPIIIDGTLQLFTTYESSNPVRLITGLLAGAVAGFALAIIVYEVAFLIKKRK